MNYKKLNEEEKARERKHIENINLQILGLQKQMTEICPIKEIYTKELDNKISAHQHQIEILRFDKENDYSFKLALDKLVSLREKIEILNLNKNVHKSHIEQGVQVSDRNEAAREKLQKAPEDGPCKIKPEERTN